MLETCGTPSVNYYSSILCSVCRFWSLCPILNGLPCWIIVFCYLQLWYPVFCTELNPSSAHVIGTLGLHCSEPLLHCLLVHRCWQSELANSAPWTKVFDCTWQIVSIETQWYWTPVTDLYLSCCIFGASYSVPGFSWDCVISFESNPTITACTLECFSEKIRTLKKPLKKTLTQFWKQIFILGDKFSILCVWKSVLCRLW